MSRQVNLITGVPVEKARRNLFVMAHMLIRKLRQFNMLQVNQLLFTSAAVRQQKISLYVMVAIKIKGISKARQFLVTSDR